MHLLTFTNYAVGPGQREGLLLQFDTPGRYVMHQLIINDFQGAGELVNQDAPMAYINVSYENTVLEINPVYAAELLTTYDAV